jgi:hypothetical protein
MNDYINKFITNIVIGQKIVDFLSGKKIDIESGIEYFLNHLNIFNQMINEKWEKKLNYYKYKESFSDEMVEKLSDKTGIVVDKLCSIEPYCKKAIKFYSPNYIFKKVGFHFRLIRLESPLYDMMGFIYYGNEIVGYICCRKGNDYKNLYIVISKKYDGDIFTNRNRTGSSVSDITEDSMIYDSYYYSMYTKHFRNMLYSYVIDIISEYGSIKNIIMIGEEAGGNLLELFMMDIKNNRSDINVKISSKVVYFLFTQNTAMMSSEFKLDYDNDIIIMNFNNRNSYLTWNIDDGIKKKCNFIFQPAK